MTLAALALAGAADVYEHRMKTDKVGVSEFVAILYVANIFQTAHLQQGGLNLILKQVVREKACFCCAVVLLLGL